MLQRHVALVTRVRQDHREKNALWGTGHGFDHAYAVASNCLKIADGEAAELAWVSAICHNTDRHYGEENVRPMMERYLSLTGFNGPQKRVVTEAVLNHSHRPGPNDELITVILMDSDKLANIDLTVLIRASQFRPNDPILDLRYPDATVKNRPPGTHYKNPGSILMDMAGCLEWEEPGWFRNLRAMELAKPKFELLRHMYTNIVAQTKEVGLFDYPFADDFAG